MAEQTAPKRITPSGVLAGPSPLVLTVKLRPVAGQDRFQPAGFPEIGHVIYKAPRADGATENVCIIDSAASMANHLESVCMRGAHDYELVDDLQGMPYLRCVTDAGWPDKKLDEPKEVVVTSLTEGHRIASTYFLEGRRYRNGSVQDKEFGDVLAEEMGIVLKGSKKAHPPAAAWWKVFKAIFRYDPNALVHGVMFPQWQVKISRALTAHLEASGAGRVDRSGVKFDRLGKTTSGQPIFAVDDATASQITATFVLDVALIRSFGRKNGDDDLGLSDSQKEFVVALALWKVRRLIESPFRFRSGCHLEKDLTDGDSEVHIDVNMKESIKGAAFREDSDANPVITDLYWPASELYRDGDMSSSGDGDHTDTNDDESTEDTENE